MKKINIYLVSDSTCETVIAVSRATLIQFQNIEADEQVWPLVRSKIKVDKLIEKISEKPGIVMYTMGDREILKYLKHSLDEYKIPSIPILSRAISDMSAYLNMRTNPSPGKQHELNDDYFARVEAINFSVAHDDGKITDDLERAEIILIGVSRTSKSPTCIYLANRGYKAANIPFIYGCNLPDILFNLKNTLIVGLSINSERLLSIRQNRILSFNEKVSNNYTDLEYIKRELVESKRLFYKQNWPIIDVSKKSVEEVAAKIIHCYQDKFN